MKDVCKPSEAELAKHDIKKVANGTASDAEITAFEKKLAYKDIENFVAEEEISREVRDKLVEKLRAPQLPYLKDRSLLAVTYYKLSGYGCVGTRIINPAGKFFSNGQENQGDMEALRKENTRR